MSGARTSAAVAIGRPADSSSGELSHRYERKYTSNVHELSALEATVLCNGGLFREAYPPRFINNVYFDTPSLAFFRDTRAGVSDRVKLRLRWYGDLRHESVVKAQLELKIRRSCLNRKEVFRFELASLDPFTPACLSTQVPEAAAEHPAVTQRLGELVPVLVNRYHRQYYRSSDRRFRITLDTGIEYFDLSGLRVSRFYPVQDANNVATVVELKYGAEEQLHAYRIARNFPLRLARNSKYANGVMRLTTCALL